MKIRNIFVSVAFLLLATAIVHAQSFSKTNYFVDTLRSNLMHNQHWVDLDGDKDLDLLFTGNEKSFVSSQVVHWIENAEQTFDKQRRIEINGVGNIRLEVADIDGNGMKDIVYASTDDDRIAWLPNGRGDTFSLEFTINNPDTDGDIFNDANGDADYVTSLKVGDIDRDGDPDIVFSNTEKIGWYMNDGQGGFSDQRFIDFQHRNIEKLINIRGDSSLDIVINGAVYEYSSSEGFLPAVSIPHGDYVDFDRDGRVDVISQIPGNDEEVSFRQNIGDSTFADGISINLGLGTIDRPVWHGDVDGDGDIDRFGFNRSYYEWVWYENKGNYEFTRHWLPQPSSDTTYSLNTDSIRTNLQHYSHPQQFGYFAFNKDSALVPINVIDNPSYYYPLDFATKDLNHDGVDDVAIAYRSKNLTVQISQPDGRFSTQELPFHAGENGKGLIRSLKFGDVDSDGDNDLLRIASKSLSWYINDGDGEFSDSFSFYQSKLDNVWVTDVNNDGYDDVVIVTSTQFETEIGWLENNQDQNFRYNVIKELPDDVMERLEVVDINRDGREDIVYMRQKDSKDRIVYWQNTGEGEYFSSGKMLLEKGNLYNLYVKDVDSDSDVDLVYGRTTGVTYPHFDKRTMWLENKGEASFASKGKRLLEHHRPIIMGDLDLDGDQDVISWFEEQGAYNNNVDKLVWMENDGSQHFTSPKEISGWKGGQGEFQLAKLSDDQKPDLLVRGLELGWLQNNIPRKHTAIGKDENRPRSFSLGENYPNPFNPTTTIQYSLPEAAEVNISIYNALGQRVATLLNQREKAGEYTVSFDGKGLSSGVYIYRIEAGDYTESRKMLLLK